MFQFKENNKTVKNFLDATRAVTGDTGTSFKEQLSYVGTFYDTPFLDKGILTEPKLNLEVFEGTDIKFQLVLKPEVTQLPQVELLNDYLNAISKGYMEEQLDKIVEPTKDHKISDAFRAQQSAVSDVQNYTLNVYFNDPEVTRQDTTINGIKYYQFKVTDTFSFGDDVNYVHSVICLFKDKTSDGENFFSSLVDKKLAIKDSKKVLDILTGNNLTGLFIGGHVTEGDKGLTQQVFAIGSELLMTKGSSNYVIKGYSSFLGIPEEAIESLTVKRTGTFKYFVQIETTDGRVTLFVG